MQEKISIIVPVYNVEKYLERCLNSILAQTYTNLEIIIINDGSTDSSLQICNEYATRDSRIKIFSKENAGPGMARNTGLQHASGEYIGFVDSDDFIERDMYEQLLTKLDSYQSDLAYCLNTSEFGIAEKTGKCYLFEGSGINELLLGQIGSKPEAKYDSHFGSSVWRGLYKKSIIVDNNLSFVSERECASEDLLFNCNYLLHCKKAVYVWDRLYHYCRNGISITHDVKHFHTESESYLYNSLKELLEKNHIVDYELQLERMLIKRYRCGLINYSKTWSFLNHRSTMKNVRIILKNQILQSILEKYPGKKLPIKQRILFYMMKYRFAFACMVLCKGMELMK